MAFPGPRRMPEFWQTATVGSILLPVVPKSGSVDVKVTPSIKLDDKKKAGKDKSNVTVERVENAKIEIEYSFNEEAWEANEDALRNLKPDGKPRDLIHPKAAIYNISAMLIEQASPIEVKDGIVTITWSGQEWTNAAPQGQPVILRRGSTGPEVTRWQTFLTEQKFGEAEGFSPIDGIFGVLTEDGTKEFQAREKIKVDGIVGPETFGAASKYGYVPPPPIQGGGGGVTTPGSSEAAAAGAGDAGAAPAGSGGAAGGGAGAGSQQPGGSGGSDGTSQAEGDHLGGDENGGGGGPGS